jgi:hypothetical protein
MPSWRALPGPTSVGAIPFPGGHCSVNAVPETPSLKSGCEGPQPSKGRRPGGRRSLGAVPCSRTVALPRTWEQCRSLEGIAPSMPFLVPGAPSLKSGCEGPQPSKGRRPGGRWRVPTSVGAAPLFLPPRLRWTATPPRPYQPGKALKSPAGAVSRPGSRGAPRAPRPCGAGNGTGSPRPKPRGPCRNAPAR